MDVGTLQYRLFSCLWNVRRNPTTPDSKGANVHERHNSHDNDVFEMNYRQRLNVHYSKLKDFLIHTRAKTIRKS